MNRIDAFEAARKRDIHRLILRIASSEFQDEEMIVAAHGLAMIDDAFAGRELISRQDPLEHEFGEVIEVPLEIVNVILATVNTVIKVRGMLKQQSLPEPSGLEEEWASHLEEVGLEPTRARQVSRKFVSELSMALGKPDSTDVSIES